MNLFLQIALSNVAMALVLAVPAVLAGYWGRRPALTHGLWLLVLAKLVTPPVWYVPIADLSPAFDEPLRALPSLPRADPISEERAAVNEDSSRGEGEDSKNAAPTDLAEVDELTWLIHEDVGPDVTAPPLPAGAAEADRASAWESTVVVGLAWGGGSLAWMLLALVRVRRFQSCLRDSLPAPAGLQAMADGLAATMQVRPLQVCLVPGTLSPMLWVFGRRGRLLIPSELAARLSPDALTTLLAHELAHWKRRDHWVRWLEILVIAGYWWCPLVWWALRELRQAEEECCDAWVVAVLPGTAREYAMALVETLDFLSDAPSPLPVSASGIGQVRLLKRRLTMILRGNTPHGLTRTGLLVLAGLGALVLPMLPTWAQAPGELVVQREADEKKERTEGREAVEQERAELQRLQAEIARAQQELERQRHVLESRMQELRRAMERLGQTKEQARTEERPPARPEQEALEKQRETLEQRLREIRRAIDGIQSTEKKSTVPPPPPGATAPKKVTAIYAQPRFTEKKLELLYVPAAPSDIERRLSEVERKLDMLLKEIRGIRGEGARPGARGPDIRPTEPRAEPPATEAKPATRAPLQRPVPRDPQPSEPGSRPPVSESQDFLVVPGAGSVRGRIVVTPPAESKRRLYIAPVDQ